MKQILVMMVVLVGCGTTGCSSTSAESNPSVDPYWISDPSDPNNLEIEKAIRSRLRKPDGALTKADLAEITYLYLPINQLRSVAGLEKLPNLRKLNLNANQLTKIPAGLDKLTNLTELRLSKNQLTNVDGLKNLPNLNILWLDQNQLTFVDGLEKLTNLEWLWLNKNQLTNLERLYLNKNQLTNVDGLEKLKNLEHLRLDDNQLANSKIAQLKKALPKAHIYGWNMLAVKPPTPTLPKNVEQLYKDGANYYLGQNGRQRDYSKAAKLFQDAAFLGHPMAQINLGACYMYGNGVDLNFQTAIAFWKIVILNPRASNEDKASAANNIKVLSGKIAKAPKGGQSVVDAAMALADKAVESMIKSNPKMIGK